MVLQSPSEQGTASVDDIKRYEVIDGACVARELMGAFETLLASWLYHRVYLWRMGLSDRGRHHSVTAGQVPDLCGLWGTGNLA
jgi:hypothetical protein